MVKKGNVMQINIGISDKDCKNIVDGLLCLFVDMFLLYLKIYNFYWNVIGLMFNILYLMFEEQYNELWFVVDFVVECICMLGVVVFGMFGEFVKLLLVLEVKGVLVVEEMICQFVEGYEVVVCIVCEIFFIVDVVSDELIVDLLIQCLQMYEKIVWMLWLLFV